MLNGKDEVFARISIDYNAKFSAKTPEQTLAIWLKELREPYVNPIGKVACLVEVNGQTVPVLLFSQTGGDQTVATIFFHKKYSIHIELSQDDNFHSYEHGGFAVYMGKILRSLKVEEKK